MIKLSKAEQTLIDFLDGRESSMGTLTLDRNQIARRSDREFDIGIEGSIVFPGRPKSESFGMSGWLPLCIIETSNWTRYADMSDYPGMVRAGDWSGIRDSDEDNIYVILALAIKDLKIKIH